MKKKNRDYVSESNSDSDAFVEPKKKKSRKDELFPCERLLPSEEELEIKQHVSDSGSDWAAEFEKAEQRKKTRKKSVDGKKEKSQEKRQPKTTHHISESESSDSQELIINTEESDKEKHSRGKKKSGHEKKDKSQAKGDSTGGSQGNGTLFIEDLSSDDEIYTFQCPENFDIRTLVNIELDMAESAQIHDKESGQIFDLQVLEGESKSVTCAFPSRDKDAALAVLPINGHVILQRDITVPTYKTFKDENRNVEFPNDLKVRHPLLGVDWKDHVSAVDEIIKKSHPVAVDQIIKTSHDESIPISDETVPKKKKRNRDYDSSCEVKSPKKRKKVH